MAWVRTVLPADAGSALRLLLDYRSDVSRAVGGLGVEMEDYVLEAEERDRAVIDTSSWGKRNRP